MRQRVFVLGAGASKTCGLPLTNELLSSIIPAIGKTSVCNLLLEFIHYLYPHFHEEWGNYPNLEELLSQFDIYVKFSKKVKAKHKFQPSKIKTLKDELLRAISIFLNSSVPDSKIKNSPISALASVLSAGDIVISFNWDLTLERALDAAGLGNSYSLPASS